MRTTLHGKFSDLIFNIEEVGSGEFEDQSDFATIVPVKCFGNIAHYPIQRKFGHATMVVCIAASGDTITPMIIAPPAKIENIWKLGYRNGEDVKIVNHQPCYVNKELFQMYIADIVIPYVENVRSIPEYQSELAYILMDNLSAHCTPEIIGLFSEHQIIVLTFPPHTSNLFQPLDLCFFSVLKNYKKTLRPEISRDSAEGQILLLLEAYEKTATGRTIRSSFSLAGLAPEPNDTKMRVVFDSSLIRNRPDFLEVYNRNLSIDEISQRRASARFGVLNPEINNN
jgi:hypothetical protein